MKVLVCILDGFSFIFSNTFLWFGENMKRLLHMPGTRRGMMYVDVDPITPEVLSAFFSRKLFYRGRIAKYIWEHVNLPIKVINLPVELPTIYVNVPRPPNWVDFFTPKKEQFESTLMQYHRFVLRYGNGFALIVWYPVPDQAHHHFFPAIGDHEAFMKAIRWYDKSAKLALDLIERFRPQRFLVLGDHSFMSDLEEAEVKGEKESYHHREAMVLTNFGEPPTRPHLVYNWLRKALLT